MLENGDVRWFNVKKPVWNGENIGQAAYDNHVTNNNNRHSSVSQSIIVRMQAGDEIGVFLDQGAIFDAEEDKFTHFIGKKLQPLVK